VGWSEKTGKKGRRKEEPFPAHLTSFSGLIGRLQGIPGEEREGGKKKKKKGEKLFEPRYPRSRSAARCGITHATRGEKGRKKKRKERESSRFLPSLIADTFHAEGKEKKGEERNLSPPPLLTQ